MTDSTMVRKTFTLTKREIEMLSDIAAHRFPNDPRVESLMIRQLIREQWVRMQKEQKPHG